MCEICELWVFFTCITGVWITYVIYKNTTHVLDMNHMCNHASEVSKFPTISTLSDLHSQPFPNQTYIFPTTFQKPFYLVPKCMNYFAGHFYD